nr:vms1 like [Quercus suber]
MVGEADQLSVSHAPCTDREIVFDLPEELLYTLQLKSESTASAETSSLHLNESAPNGDGAQVDTATKSATSCALCSLNFPTVVEQRQHVRSDLHGFNIKQKLRAQKPVTESEFERLVGDLDESISGSETEDTDEEDDPVNASKPKDTTLSALLKRQAKITDGDADDAPAKRKQGSGKPPLLWFASSKLPSNTSLGVYRAIFSADEQAEETHLVETVQRKQLAAKPPPPPQAKQKVFDDGEEDGGVPISVSSLPKNMSTSEPHYFLCMIGGGHFAAMLVSLAPKLTKKFGVEDRSATVIAHKTFHRYTTRRKQGGSQSSNDNSKGNAHSAGAGIRRYNESALEQEVRDLLTEWKSWIETSQLLFVRATGSTNRRTLFGPYDGQVLDHRDDRIRGFPFNTRRATQSELMRAFIELTRVKISTVDEAALAKQAEEAAAAAAAAAALKAESTNNNKHSTSKPVKLSKAEEEAALHTTQIQALIRRSKAPGLVTYLQSNGLASGFHFFPTEANHHAPTPLHLAASSNSPACVSSLLLKVNVDPSIRSEEGKSAFDIAGDRPTRDAFRLARSQLGESRWQWDAAGVPSALSQAEVDARTAREKEDVAAEAAAEKQRRDAEAERLRKKDADENAGKKVAKFGKGHVMDRPKMTAEETRMEQARGMTDEMRTRLEREKRARAAEERMKRLQGNCSLFFLVMSSEPSSRRRESCSQLRLPWSESQCLDSACKTSVTWLNRPASLGRWIKVLDKNCPLVFSSQTARPRTAASIRQIGDRMGKLLGASIANRVTLVTSVTLPEGEEQIVWFMSSLAWLTLPPTKECTRSNHYTIMSFFQFRHVVRGANTRVHRMRRCAQRSFSLLTDYRVLPTTLIRLNEGRFCSLYPRTNSVTTDQRNNSDGVTVSADGLVQQSHKLHSSLLTPFKSKQNCY